VSNRSKMREEPVRQIFMLVSVFCLSALASDDAYASCSGASCDGRDPVVEGCDDDAVTVETEYISYGASVKLLYSPSCQTNWARVYSSSRRYLRARIQVYDIAPGHSYSLYWPSSSSYTYGTNIWTDMYYCPTGECIARATGYVKTTSSGTVRNDSTNWY